MKRFVGALVIGLLGAQFALANGVVMQVENLQRSTWDINHDSDTNTAWNRIGMAIQVKNTPRATEDAVNAARIKIKEVCGASAVETRSDGTFGPSIKSIPSRDSETGVLYYSFLYQCK